MPVLLLKPVFFILGTVLEKWAMAGGKRGLFSQMFSGTGYGETFSGRVEGYR